MRPASDARLFQPSDEAELFRLCKACQLAIDMRDLIALFHHEEPGHERGRLSHRASGRSVGRAS